MKLRLLAALVAALSVGVASAQDYSSEKNKLSYSIGYEIGRDLAERGIDVDVNSVVRAMQDGYGRRDPAVAPQEMAASLQAMTERMRAQAMAEFERVSNENKARSDSFLAENRGKQGVTVLPSGIQYRVIEQGNGARPAANSNVRVHFRASLTSGQDFASTYSNVQQPGQEPQPATVNVSEAFMPGLSEVLPLMNTGARWEVFLPPDQAYGNDPRSPIGPNQVVVFDIKLVSID